MYDIHILGRGCLKEVGCRIRGKGGLAGVLGHWCRPVARWRQAWYFNPIQQRVVPIFWLHRKNKDKVTYQRRREREKRRSLAKNDERVGSLQGHETRGPPPPPPQEDISYPSARNPLTSQQSLPINCMTGNVDAGRSHWNIAPPKPFLFFSYLKYEERDFIFEFIYKSDIFHSTKFFK